MSTDSDPRATATTMWQTRPTRRQSDRKLAGVAGAIARRYDVDPVLVRIGFVVAAFYGVGILLYLAGWVVLEPDPDDPPRGALATGSVVRVLVYVLLVLAILQAIHRLFTGDLDFLVGLLVVGGVLCLLQISRGDHGLRLAQAQRSRTDGADSAAPGAAESAATPLGPSASATPGHRRSRVTLVTIALALVAAGIAVGVLILLPTALAGPRLVVGVLLAVVGVGLLVGAFTRGGRGLILLAIPLVLIGYGMTRLPVDHWRGAGELRVAPTSVSQLAGSYDRSVGRIELDLRRLDLSAPSAQPAPSPPPAPPAPGAPPIPPAAPAPGAPPAPPAPVRTSVSLQLGEAVVRVPANADVHVHCHAGMGDVSCLGQRSDDDDADGTERTGPTADAQVDSLGADGAAGGRPLELDVNVGMGHVEVRRD